MKKIAIVLSIIFICTVTSLKAQDLTQVVTDRINNDVSDIASKTAIMNGMLAKDAILQNDIQVLNGDIQADQNDIQTYNGTILNQAITDDAQAQTANPSNNNNTSQSNGT